MKKTNGLLKTSILAVMFGLLVACADHIINVTHAYQGNENNPDHSFTTATIRTFSDASPPIRNNDVLRANSSNGWAVYYTISVHYNTGSVGLAFYGAAYDP